MSYCLEEVFEMACQIERNGERFYRRAAKAVSSVEARDLLEELADWEHRHESTFVEMRDEMPEDVRTAYVDPQGEASAYLDAMVAGKVFDVARAESEIPDSVEEIIRIALGKEKDSIVFYLGMLEAVPDGKEHIQRIITEEMRHIRILTRMVEKGVAGE